MSQVSATLPAVDPARVHEILRQWMLADGLPIVVDLEASQGSILVDAASGREYLDFFGCFGSSPLGWNPPALRAAWQERARPALVNRPSNSDLYSREMAAFVQTFAGIALPEGYRHLFFIDGGALAVENALKAAFDWKIRRNRAKGVDADVGTRILHFRHAFHGRSGYTMSLTNTLPNKTRYFPKFDWPRVSSPALRFPAGEEALAEVREAERRSLAEIDASFAEHGDDIAAVILEPVQCEGGDRHFRSEFLQAVQARCERYDCLFIVDEVQTGFFASGKPWAFQHHGITPDIIVFGKKAQQCGIIAGPKIDLVPENVFSLSSRINSTWGGNLVDMVRATRILEEVRDRDLAANAAARGGQWLEAMAPLASRHPALVSNVRALGLLMAFDLPDGAARDRTLLLLREEGLLALACGDRSIRFRPHLAVTAEEIDRAVELTGRALQALG